ncbi:MAG: insulinase family protein [Candidatus Hydrogenedentes bacterium]|nr:insulinase family protein [Candidatus Hydrogenedentota bacterium]
MTQPSLLVEIAPTVRKLANGITVLMEPLPHIHSVAAGLWIKTGSANERSEQAGISHFLEHLFFKGTTTRTARQLMEAVESKGGHVNAFTSREYTCIYAKTLAAHLGTGIEILADILKNSLFCDLEKERNVILEEIASNEDVPEEYAHDLFTERIWPGVPLGRPITGTLESVSGITLDDIRAYYSAWYFPENVVVSIAGNFDCDRVFEQVRRELEGIPPRSASSQRETPPFSSGHHYVTRDITQTHLCFGFPGPSATDPQRYVYDMLSNSLGGGPISRLFERIRENEGLAYAIYTFSSSYLTTGMMGVYAAVAPENLEKTIRLAFEEVRKLRDEPLPAAELETNREQLKGNLLMALENTSNRMTRMAKGMLYHGRLLTIAEVVEAIDAVKAADIQELAQGLFQPERCAMLVLGPEDGASKLDFAL